MTRESIKIIEDFIEDELRGYDIKYDYTIENNELEAEFTGLFLENSTISFSFKCEKANLEFYSISESYIYAETRQFWIEFMTKLLKG